MCKFNKVKKIILKYFIKKFLGFYKWIYFDIIEFIEGFNDNNYIFYFYYKFIKINYVYINVCKFFFLYIIKDFIVYIKRRFNLDIKIFKLNNKIFFIKKFKI